MGLGTLPTLQPDVLVFFRAKVEVSTRGNRDGGKGIPKCWTAALKRSEGWPTGGQTATSSGKTWLLVTPNDALCMAING